jgi:hypothetical protein
VKTLAELKVLGRVAENADPIFTTKVPSAKLCELNWVTGHQGAGCECV